VCYYIYSLVKKDGRVDMITILCGIYIILCVLLILIILVQAGKGGGLVATFGGGASSSLLGPRRGTILTRSTAIIGSIFLLLAFILSLALSKPASIMKQKKGKIEELPIPTFTPGTPTATYKKPTGQKVPPFIPRR